MLIVLGGVAMTFTTLAEKSLYDSEIPFKLLQIIFFELFFMRYLFEITTFMLVILLFM